MRARPALPKRNRSDNARAAWIGALAGSLVAAVIAGSVALSTASLQISADNRRVTTEFLRQEQKVAYAKFLTDVESLRAAFRNYQIRFLPYETPPSLREAQSLKAPVDAAFDELKLSLVTVQLVGSPEAAADASQVDNAFHPMMAWVWKAYLFIKEPEMRGRSIQRRVQRHDRGKRSTR